VDGELDPGAVAAFRLSRQRLSQPAPAEGLAAVCGALGGVQAQVLEGAEHAVGLRVREGFARVRPALWEERSLVRTYTWRGTFHLVPADEFELWVAASRPGMPRPPKVPAAEHDALAAAIGDALDGEPLTRQELGSSVGGALGERIAGPGGDMLVKDAAARGLLCLAEPAGRSSRLTRPERWLRRALRDVDPADADRHALRAFLRAYGPATPQEVARWAGRGSVKRATAWRALLGDEVADTASGWLLAEDVDAVAGAAPVPDEVVHLLPSWDPYTVALPSLVPEAAYKQVFASAGRVEPVVLAGGRAVATWRFTRAGEAVRVELTPFPGARVDREAVAAALPALAPLLRAARAELAP
jgi:hypothetical protein